VEVHRACKAWWLQHVNGKLRLRQCLPTLFHPCRPAISSTRHFTTEIVLKRLHYNLHIPVYISTMPSATPDLGAELLDEVHQLKVDRDNWRTIATQYKTAFEAQKARFLELQDICFAAQAELENEKFQQSRHSATSNENPCKHTPPSKDTATFPDEGPFGTAIILPSSRIDLTWRERTATNCSNPIFSRAQQFAQQQDHGTALVEVERLLRGPLSAKGRIEGLLLKSSILQVTGPEHLYDALAACSEALEICTRTRGLDHLLPRIQYQRGICFYQLRMLHQARDAFSAVNGDDLLLGKAHTYRKSCEDELDLLHCIGRRSGFDEDRTMTDQLLAQINEESFHVSERLFEYSLQLMVLILSQSKLRRTSAHLKFRAAAKTKRMSLPHRWATPGAKTAWTI
jgi:hypothetical protein